MIAIEFEKDNVDNWYAVLPEYSGPKADLQMVSGADTMLDVIDMNTWNDKKVKLELLVDDEIDSTKEYVGVMTLIREDEFIGGGWYKVAYSTVNINEAWLCDVSKFVFGYMPRKIAFNIL